MKPSISNKEIVLSFYRDLLGKRDTSLARELIREDYIQHNPMVKTGRQGVVEAIEFLKQFPQPEDPKSPIRRIFSDGDYVFVHLQVEIGGAKQVVMDLFRIESGQLAEHWDCIQLHPETTANGHSMIDGETESRDLALTETNRSVMETYYPMAFISRNTEALSDYVDPELIQHHPDIANGIDSLAAYLSPGNSEFVVEKAFRIQAEGNFVWVQAKGQVKGEPYVFYDLFRLSDKKIVEHWHTRQAIPADMRHENGMI